MVEFAQGAAFVSLFVVYYLYDGYGRLLEFLLFVLGYERKNRDSDLEGTWPSITVILPVFNEEKQIKKKLENILAQSYGGLPVEIIVVSDGSTDKTEEIVETYQDRGVKLLRTPGRLGKSLAQNLAVAQSNGEILVLTDVAVEMAPGCLKELVMPFRDQNVGCTTSHLLFRYGNRSDTGEAQGIYWRYELKLRILESNLGILATAAGPAMAIRRNLWKDLVAEYGDDCVLPLNVVLGGKKVMHVLKALAWDESFETVQQEFKARVRMTVRNWTGTTHHGQLLNPVRHPAYAFTLWSHKILRWLSPLFIFVLGLSLVYLAYMDGETVWLSCYSFVILLAWIGYVGMKRGIRIPVVTSLTSFFVANVGFAVGLGQVMMGKMIKIYENG